MSFDCVELTIIDDPSFGCTVKFSDTIDKGYEEDQTIDEIMNSKEKYFSIQRSYPEDLYENDFYSIETTESDVELGQSDRIFIQIINNESLEINWCSTKIEIGLKIEESDIIRLRKILQKRFKDRVKLKEK